MNWRHYLNGQAATFVGQAGLTYGIYQQTGDALASCALAALLTLAITCAVLELVKRGVLR